MRWTGKPARVGASGDAAINYTEALAWLYSLQRFGIKLGLENIQRLIAELHVDLSNARVIHVAGTNGKGSVCAMIDSICRAQEYRTGLFTSPHLVTFRERIRINGKMISESEVAAGLTTVQKLVADWEPHPTFFEIATALALKHFAVVTAEPTVGDTRLSQQGEALPSPSPPPSSRGERIKMRGESKSDSNVDVVILETGLGGRLDATNAIQSDVAVITPIALDHEQWLGDSLEKIAREKAGIIKPRTMVVSAPQLTEAKKVIRARAAECEAPLQFVDQPYEKSPIALRAGSIKNSTPQSQSQPFVPPRSTSVMPRLLAASPPSSGRDAFNVGTNALSSMARTIRPPRKFLPTPGVKFSVTNARP